MKVYLSKDGRFEAPGKQSKGAEKIDVPTDTAGLVDYLNELTANVPPQDALEFEPAPPPTRGPDPELVKIGETLRQTSWTTDSIVDFILDGATVSQVERLFSCIGTRFAELVKGVRA
jgi:hypothetical protein